METKKTSGNLSRRAFTPAAVAAFSFVPRYVLGGTNQAAPSDKLNIAAVGFGGMGQNYIKGCESENIAALCDVDEVYAAPVFARYPNAKRYRDYRVMLEKEKGIDAVIIGTPDHSHALVASAAMELGKHVYCAKPLTRTIWEARTLVRIARDKKLATQMSVQSCASEDACATEEWVKSGVIGEVRDVHVWSDRPIWPQSIARPVDAPKIPEGLEWDLWLAGAPERPYHPIYHPFAWRGWTAFGTGALGDMACHYFHMVFRALGLSHPTSVDASTTAVVQGAIEETNGRYRWRRRRDAGFPETFPHSSIVTWDFSRERVRLYWYDGGLKPPRPAPMSPDEALSGDGVMFVGTRGVIFSSYDRGPRLSPRSLRESFQLPEKTVPRTIGHYREWVAACKGGKTSNCNFEFGGLLTETALLGVIAQRTGKYLTYDAEAARINNEKDANALIQEPYRAGWSL
jgi:predicted dehydrogenase